MDGPEDFEKVYGTISGLDVSSLNKLERALGAVSMARERLSEMSGEESDLGEMEDRLVRMFEGGGDGVDIGWEQIRQVAEVKYDNVPLVDIVISLLTNLSSVLARKERYDIVEEIEEKGPANIIAKLPGREQPLFEIFAVENPREVWALIKGMAEIMAEEEGPETIKDLLQVLNEN